MFKIVPREINENIIDFLHGDIKTCEKKHKDKFSMKSIELVAEISIIKLRKLPMVLEVQEVRKDTKYLDRREEYYSNVLYKLKWKDGFKGPGTVLIMYRNFSWGDNFVDYETFFETYGYFWKHKPDFLSDYQWEYTKGDVVRHKNLEELLMDVYKEDSMWK
jgi:hypothetical protein